MPVEVADILESGFHQLAGFFFSVSYPCNVLIFLEVYELRIDECAVKRFMALPRAGEEEPYKIELEAEMLRDITGRASRAARLIYMKLLEKGSKGLRNSNFLNKKQKSYLRAKFYVFVA